MYLKDVRCERCNGRYKVNTFVEKDGSITTDGATCVVCEKNMPLHEESYYSFMSRLGYR